MRVSIIILYKYLSLLFDDVLFCLPFCWCPCMAINVSVQYDGGFLPDIILLTQCYHQIRRRRRAARSLTNQGRAEPLCARIESANREVSEGKADL